MPNDRARSTAPAAHDAALRPVVVQSWHRSESSGLDRNAAPTFSRVAEDDLQCRLYANSVLLEISIPHLRWLSEWFDARPHVAYVADADGVVLDPNPENRDSGNGKTNRLVVSSAGRLGQPEEPQMPRKGRSYEDIIHALHQVEGGEKVTEVCRRLGVSEQAFYRWKKQFTGLGLQELRELRSLRHENSKLKQVVADLTLDRHILQEIVRKKL